MKEKILAWRKSAAGKISVILFFVSVVLLVIACSPWGNLSETTANHVNNILIGLATNLLGIIVTVSFVQYFLDRQDEREQKKEETEAILRYDRIMRVLVEQYVINYNCVTVPMEKRDGIKLNELRTDFPFEDMCDLHLQALNIYGGFLEPAIEVFYRAEERLRDYMIEELGNVQFQYHEELKEIFLEFLEKSFAYDVRGGILKNTGILSGQEKMTDFVRRCIKDKTRNWVDKAHKGELSTNLILPYTLLYDLLKIEINLIIRYENYMNKLRT